MSYEILFDPIAEKELDKMNSELRLLFIRHAEKLKEFTPGKHLKFGLPYFVEKVTKQTRFAFDVTGNIITIIRCFKNHKDYEDWYKSYK